MWNARNKTDLIIEVWEKLDCESVGAVEIEAIETVIESEFGRAAVDSPMVLARLLADEGAQLRHSEVMDLYLQRASDRPYDAALRNILKLDDLRSALLTIRDLENLRQKYKAEHDREGLRLLRELTIGAKKTAITLSTGSADAIDRQIHDEIANWLTIWLQTPEVFENWVDLRQRSPDFTDKFCTKKEG